VLHLFQEFLFLPLVAVVAEVGVVERQLQEGRVEEVGQLILARLHQALPELLGKEILVGTVLLSVRMDLVVAVVVQAAVVVLDQAAVEAALDQHLQLLALL
jgi:hypothetical protein